MHTYTVIIILVNTYIKEKRMFVMPQWIHSPFNAYVKSLIVKLVELVPFLYCSSSSMAFFLIQISLAKASGLPHTSYALHNIVHRTVSAGNLDIKCSICHLVATAPVSDCLKPVDNFQIASYELEQPWTEIAKTTLRKTCPKRIPEILSNHHLGLYTLGWRVKIPCNRVSSQTLV